MGSPLTLGQWSHLAIVFDGTQARFYVNGNLVRVLNVREHRSITARDSLLYMAADVRPTQFFNGTLDDVRVYNRAESQSEVQTDMNTQLAAPASDPTAPSVSITSPANDAVVSGNRTITADASDDVGVAGVQFYVDGNPLGPEDTTAPYAANWDTRAIPNGAHTLAARARDTDGKTKLSPLVNVTVANSDHFQNQVLATGFDLPTNIEFLPDGRMLVAELAGKIKVLPPPYTTPDPAPFLQITNIGSNGVQQGIFDLALDPDFATNHHYYVFYTLGTPNADRLSRFTANASLTGTVPGSELVLYQDPGGAPASTTAAPSTSATTGSSISRPASTSRDALAGPEQPAREDPPHQQGRARADRQPVLRRRRASLGFGLGLRPAQPVPRLLRRPDRPAVHR